MDNSNKRNDQKSNQSPNVNTNTKMLNTEEEKSNTTNTTLEEKKRDTGKVKDFSKAVEEKKENNKTDLQLKGVKKDTFKKDMFEAKQKNEKVTADSKAKQDTAKKGNELSRVDDKKLQKEKQINTVRGKTVTDFSSVHIRQIDAQPKSEKKDTLEAKQKNEIAAAENNAVSRTKQDNVKKENELSREDNKKLQKERQNNAVRGKSVTDFSSDHIKQIAMNAAKILLPVAACAVVIAVAFSYAGSRKSQMADNTSLNLDENSDAAAIAILSNEPLAENAYEDVNDLMRTFYTALADGDMDTVRTLKDYNTDREIITYEKKSEFIESYDNVNCYTKSGIEENSYFVYATYDVKIKDITTEAPGLNAFYVYTAEDGNLRIDGDTEENIKAAFKLVTSQDDVVDLYNKIDVNYTEATASDEALDQFMAELPKEIKESVGVALAQLEAEDIPQTDDGTEQTQSAETETTGESEEPLQNKVVNQLVRTTDTVNVRSSDSEEADKIGKAQTGMELTRTEERINGWSKVIFEDKEAYIKSDYLEVVATSEAAESIGAVVAMTNVNVRSQASQDSDRIGSAQEGTSYNLLEEQGEWYKIDYNGTAGYVKAEFFQR
ncbi:MAG: SH3 domain-containing protein [Lachnospiraceae bacterium]|nr:SH3 domain-containing protein [Lachnospiraceae bacterium]